MAVIANWDILYRGRMFKKGEVIPQPDPLMVEAWKKSGAASVATGSRSEVASAADLEGEAEGNAGGGAADEPEHLDDVPMEKPMGRARRTTAPGAPGKRAGGTGAEGDMVGVPPKQK